MCLRWTWNWNSECGANYFSTILFCLIKSTCTGIYYLPVNLILLETFGLLQCSNSSFIAVENHCSTSFWYNTFVHLIIHLPFPDFVWSLSNDIILSASFDGTARLWKVASGECMRVFKDITGAELHSCLFHPLNNNMFVVSFIIKVMYWQNMWNGIKCFYKMQQNMCSQHYAKNSFILPKWRAFWRYVNSRIWLDPMLFQMFRQTGFQCVSYSHLFLRHYHFNWDRIELIFLLFRKI